MYVEHDPAGNAFENENDLFGPTPPRGVYFIMEFEHNPDHPMNRAMDPADQQFSSAPQKTMDEARVLAQVAASDWAKTKSITLIENAIEFDEDGVDLPSYIGIDSAEVTDGSIVFTAMVRMFDYRAATLH